MGYLDKHDFSIERIDYKGRAMGMAARIQLVLQIDQGNLDGMRELASTDAVYIADAERLPSLFPRLNIPLPGKEKYP